MVEHRELTITRRYQIEWRRQVFELKEVAERRWINKLKIDDIALEFGLGTTQIKFYCSNEKNQFNSIKS